MIPRLVRLALGGLALAPIFAGCEPAPSDNLEESGSGGEVQNPAAGGADPVEGSGGSASGGDTSLGGEDGGGSGGMGIEPPKEIDYGSIDITRLPSEPWKNTQWQDPGSWTEIDVSEHGLLPGETSVDASLKIAEILAETSGRRRLFFPAGTYSFKTTLEIKTGDIWIQGAGTDTLFRIDAPGDQNVELRILGGALGSPVDVPSDLAPGSQVIQLSDTTGFEVGDIVQLYADNAPLAQGGRAWSSELYSQLLRVVEKTDSQISLDMKVLLDYPLSYTPRVRKLAAISNVKVSDLKIARINEPSVEAVTNLAISSAYNAEVSDIESEFSGRNHVHFTLAKDCVMERNYVHDTWKHTTGGYGYGLSLAVTTGCRITNNKTSRLRHQIILQVGANHSVVSYNSVEAPWHYNDLALHATYAYMNLFEGNVFSEGYSDKSKDGQAVEATTGPGNTWFRNYASVLVGNQQGDTNRQNVIGNFTREIPAAGADHYIGANLVGTTMEHGVLPEDAVLPPSLYLTEAPDFFAEDAPFPLFGPDVPDFGLANAPPARATPEESVDRVSNGGFEAADFSGWDNPGDVYSVSDEDAHTGDFCLELAGEGGWANVQQNVTVAQNRMYTLFYWAKSESTGGRVKMLTPTSVEVMDCGSTVVDSQWRQYFCNFNSGANTSLDIYVGDGGGHHFFDDFEVY